jgi:hypothetical protein
MAETKSIGKYVFIPVAEIDDTMIDAYKIVMSIPFNNNSILYFNQIYQELNNRIERDKKFLKNVECHYSYQLFKKILDDTNKYDASLNIQLDKIEPNNILLIKCPSIFAPYHFIIVVVSEHGNEVDIYQSFGSSKRLYKLNLPFATFIQLMGRLSTFKDDINFNEDYQMMTEIESQLYGINIPEYTSFLTEQFEEQQEKNRKEQEDDEDDEDDEFEIDDATIAKAEELGIAPILYEQLEGQYNLTSKEIEITQYKLKPNPIGGKAKRKTRKLKGKKRRQTKRKKNKFL